MLTTLDLDEWMNDALCVRLHHVVGRIPTERIESRADYEWVFRSCFARIHRTVFLVLRDYDRAEKITQDAFLKLLENWRKASSFE
jgi:hypothetical protein